MKEIIIEIKDKTITGLSGRDLGEDLYKVFLENEIDLESGETYSIIFPEFVEDIDASVVKGMTSKIFKKISKYDFYEFFTVEGSESAVSDFKRGVYY